MSISGSWRRAAFTDLATRYPSNPHDAWWLLGELYERRLRDDARARAAYAQVPADVEAVSGRAAQAVAPLIAGLAAASAPRS